MIQAVPLKAIAQPEPEESEAQQEITESLKEKGLLQAVILRSEKTPDPRKPIPEGSLKIVAGKRRVRAALALGWDHIEAEIRSGISDFEALETSLHENLKRNNLMWWERAAMLATFHEVKQKQFGAPPRQGGRGAEGWGVRDTAKALGVGLGPLNDSLNLARAVEADPALKNIKDKKTAMRLVRLKVQRVTEEAEAGIPQLSRGFESAVLMGNSVDVLKHYPDATFDACITDPPWLRFRDIGILERDEHTLNVFKEVYRVLKNHTLLYAVVSLDDLNFYSRELPRFGFKISKTPLLWRKRNSLSRMGVKPWEYNRDFEFIILAAKGMPVLKSSTAPSSVLEFPIVPVKLMIHPHEKPIELIIKILGDCSFENNKVIDPFGGSGVVAEACRQTKRHYVVIEREKEFHDRIVGRLRGDTPQTESGPATAETGTVPGESDQGSA